MENAALSVAVTVVGSDVDSAVVAAEEAVQEAVDDVQAVPQRKRNGHQSPSSVVSCEMVKSSS